jgi:hypothetical protein
MPPSDRELPETLDLIAKLVASVSTRLDKHGEALDRLTQAQAQAMESMEPDRIAAATGRSIRQTLSPDLHKLVDAMQELNGTKALLRKRWQAVDEEEARLGRWRFQPWAVTLGIPLALGLLLAAVMPSAVSQTPLTCRAAGGIWWAQTERYPAACLFTAKGRLHQATGPEGEADAGSS